MRDQREHESPVTVHDKDDDGAVVVERRGTEYVVVWETVIWREEGEVAGAWRPDLGGGPRWYIRTPDEDIPIPQHNAYSALGEARVHEAQAKVAPPRRAGRRRKP